MAQFDIVKNRKNQNEVELLLELQSDAVSVLDTRIVAPLRTSDDFSDKFISKIHIQLTIGDKKYIAFISEMAAVPADMLGALVDNVASCRTDIVSAIDLLFTGF